MTKKHTNPNLIMLGLLIGGFVGMFSETALNIAIPELMTQFDISAGTVQWLLTGYLLLIGITLPLASLLTKLFSTRKLVIFAICDFMVGAIIAALAVNFPMLLVGRLIQGLATGIILPLIFIVLLAVYPPNKRGAAMGLVGLVIMFAPAIGPTLAGLIIGLLSWRFIFWLLVPLMLIALFITLRFMKNVTEVTKPKVDFFSILLSTIGFGGLVIGASMASDAGWGSPVVLVSLLIGLLALFFYGKRQLKLDTPILDVRAFQTKRFTLGLLLVILNFAMIMSSMYLLPMFWQKGMGISATETGLLMLPAGVLNAFFSIISGRLFDRFGAKAIVQLGFLFAICGSALLVFATNTSSIWYVLIAHMVLMVGIPLIMSPAQMYGLNALSGPQASDGSSILNTLQQIFGAVATAITTSLLSFGEINAQDAGKSTVEAFVQGSHLGFGFTLAIAVIGLIVAFGLKKPSAS
ncbi:DHA2 family efflux MFS transporter permease subunit [Listeria costaricensis]|uniref:DHA2 family efflux MFS transporter permease subunit n=1 Tax=Listeria costaricensis TaxID=2026604 RepID=UPI000C08322C|nr:DHA2 family efflux MFS transporter permease subunit [Listeria costaricensis]